MRRLQVSEDIGAAEPVDGLFRIANEKQPVTGAREDGFEDSTLHRIGVLELVDERGFVFASEFFSQGGPVLSGKRFA
jgi:hypothetical protein